MAGNGYSYWGYSTYNTPESEDWSKTSYTSNHVCRPVIIDADGRKRPIISYTPIEIEGTHVIKAEKLAQEHVPSPMSSEYIYGARPAYDLDEDYVTNAYGAGKKWQQPNDCQEKVEGFLKKVQVEVSRPWFGPLNTSPWCTPTYASYQSESGGYGALNGKSNKEWQTSNGNSYRNNRYDDYYQKSGSPMDLAITSNGWTRPSQTTWSPPTDASLSKPTNDTNTAMRPLQEVAPRSQSVEQAYPETIDSKEAARRYRNFNFAPRPSATEDNYTTTIDSREAARKYRGTTI